MVSGTPIASGLHRKASDSGLLALHFSNSRAGRTDNFRDRMLLFLTIFFHYRRIVLKFSENH